MWQVTLSTSIHTVATGERDERITKAQHDHSLRQSDRTLKTRRSAAELYPRYTSTWHQYHLIYDT